MSAISYPTSPARDTYEFTPWTDASGNQWLFSPAKLRWRPYVTSGGGGVSTFAALTDKASVNLPVVNAPLAAALDLKANLISPSFTTPVLGAATATSINKVEITQPANGSTLTIADGVTVSAGSNITLAPGGSITTGAGSVVSGSAGSIATHASGWIAVKEGSHIDLGSYGPITTGFAGPITTGAGGSFSTSTGTVAFSNTAGNPITLTAPSGGSTATLPAGISTLARTNSGGGTQTFSGPQAMSGTLSVTGALTGTTASFSNTVAGTATTPAIDIASTWTTTGEPTALKVNVVSNTGPSSASSLLMDLQAAGSSRFRVYPTDATNNTNGFRWGGATTGGDFLINASGNTFSIASNGNHDVALASNYFTVIRASSGGGIRIGSAVNSPRLFYDSDSILAQRNGTNAQTSRVYGTYASTTSYERLGIEAGKTGGTGEHVIDSQKGSGGGSLLPIRLKMGGTTSLEIGITGHVTASGTVMTGGYTVATLPTPTVGMRCHVTDANSTTFYSAVAGGGSNIVPVFYNGTNWVIA